MSTTVPIMILKLVMLPEALYPLHIFEERYKIMINEAIKNDTTFGIVADLGNDLARTGCLVKVTKVINSYEDGSFDIIVKGLSRFLIFGTKKHVDEYTVATYKIFIDDEYQIEEELYLSTYEKLKQVFELTNLELEDAFWENLANATHKSFKIAEKAGLTLKQRQELVLMRNENTRLHYLNRHLEKIIKYVDQDLVLRQLVASDGYLN